MNDFVRGAAVMCASWLIGSAVAVIALARVARRTPVVEERAPSSSAPTEPAPPPSDWRGVVCRDPHGALVVFAVEHNAKRVARLRWDASRLELHGVPDDVPPDVREEIERVCAECTGGIGRA